MSILGVAFFVNLGLNSKEFIQGGNYRKSQCLSPQGRSFGRAYFKRKTQGWKAEVSVHSRQNKRGCY